MATSEEVRLIIKAEVDRAISDLKNFNAQLAATSKSSKTAETGFGALKNSWFAAIGILGTLATAVRYIVKETNEAQQAQSQLNAVLKSTNGAAGLTAEAVNKIAENLAEMTAYDNDAIVSGQNLLLTFTRIGKDVFPAASAAMLDMSAAMGTDLKSSAIQLGKALQDPIQGANALRRVGVQLTETQQTQIKSFMQMNDIASAQKIILAELNTEFGGSAAAQLNTYDGQIKKLSNSLGDIAKIIGATMFQDFRNLAAGLNAFASPGNLSMLKDLVETIWEVGKTASRVSFGVMTVGLSEIYRWYKKITEKTIPLADAMKLSKDELIPKIPRGGENVASVDLAKKAYEEKIKYQIEYLAYTDQIEKSELLKAQEKYKALLALAKIHGGDMAALKKGLADAEAAVEQQDNINAIERVKKKVEQIAGLMNILTTGLSRLSQLQAQTEIANEQAKYKKTKMYMDLFIQDEGQRKQAEEALALRNEFIMNQIRRREFEREKILRIAGVWMSAGTAVMGAVAGSFATIPNPIAAGIVAGVFTAAILAMAGYETALIASQQAPAMAEGGLIQGSASGSLIRAGEGGRSEAIIPFNNPDAMERLGGMGGSTYHVHMDGAILVNQDLPREFIAAIDKGLYKLNQDNQSAFARAI